MPIDSFKARQATEIAGLIRGGETDEVRRLAMGVWDEQARMSPRKAILGVVGAHFERHLVP